MCDKRSSPLSGLRARFMEGLERNAKNLLAGPRVLAQSTGDLIRPKLWEQDPGSQRAGPAVELLSGETLAVRRQDWKDTGKPGTPSEEAS